MRVVGPLSRMGGFSILSRRESSGESDFEKDPLKDHADNTMAAVAAIHGTRRDRMSRGTIFSTFFQRVEVAHLNTSPDKNASRSCLSSTALG